MKWGGLTYGHTVQQTGSWEDIWRIHQAVMKLFGFFYKTTQVSLMDKVGAGKHISVMAQHCWRKKNNKLSSHISHPLNPCLSLRLNYSFLAALVFNLCLSPHVVFLHPSVILPCHPIQDAPPLSHCGALKNGKTGPYVRGWLTESCSWCSRWDIYLAHIWPGHSGCWTGLNNLAAPFL